MRSSLLCTPSIHTHTSACHCRPLAQLKHKWDEASFWKVGGFSFFFLSLNHFFFFLLKVIKINPINSRMKTLLVFARLPPQKPKYSHSSMSSVNRTVALSNTDHDRPLSCFSFCSHHLQARWCEIGHCDPFFRIRRKLSAGLLVSSLFMSSSGARDN